MKLFAKVYLLITILIVNYSYSEDIYTDSITDAFTLDTNGNGYLDKIRVHCSKNYDDAQLSRATFLLQRGTTQFTINDVITSDSGFYLIIQELKNDRPQTGYLPYLRAANMPASFLSQPFMCKDNAGPVIWSVEKKVGSQPHTDVVNVRFSEAVFTLSKAHIPVSIAPESIFNVLREENGNFLLLDSVLTGIETLSSTSDSVVTFTMYNGIDLYSKYFLALNSQKPTLMDAHGNLPSSVNQKVRVAVSGGHFKMLIAPSPSASTTRRCPAGFFEASDNPNSTRWITSDHAGTVFFLSIPTPQSGTVHAKVNIHSGTSIFGPIVQKGESLNLLVRSYTTISDVEIYWNGYGEDGKKVLPGPYLVEVKIEYESNLYTNRTLIDTVIIIDQDKKAYDFGGCGNGISLAIFPIIGLKFRRMIKKRHKR